MQAWCPEFHPQNTHIEMGKRTTSNPDGGQKNAAGAVKKDIGFLKSTQQLLLVTKQWTGSTVRLG